VDLEGRSLEPLHSLLKRQLKRCFDESLSLPAEWQRLIAAVNDAYREFDTDRAMLERSLELSSQELLQANSEMRAVFRAFPDLLFRLDHDGTIIDYQASGTTDFYLQPQELLGRRIQDVPLKGVGAEFRNAIRKVQETKSVVNVEYCLMIQDQKRCYEARLLPLLDNQIIVIIRNITERKQAEEAFRDSERRFADIVEFLPDATFVIDQERKVIAWNRAMEKMTGVRAEDILGKGDYAYATPFYGHQRPIVIDLVLDPDAEIERRYDLLKRKGNSLYAENFLPLLRGGEGAYVSAIASPLFDNNGKQIGAIESIRDITERKRVEEALSRAEEKYRSIFENAIEGIFQTTPDGRIISANPAFARILGYDSPEELLNTVADLSQQVYVNLEDRVELMRLVEERGVLREFEVRLVRKDKSTAWITLNVHAVRDSAGRIIYLEGTAQDITERKELESRILQMQKMDAIGTLAGGIAHDFNNILAAILGYTEVAQGESDQSAVNDHLERILEACDRARNLVGQILTFSRKTDMEKRPVDMVSIVTEALDLLRATLPSTIRIHSIFAQRVYTVLADPTQIHQVLINLGTNAAHAMREKGGVLEIRLDNVEITPQSKPLHPDLNVGPYVKLTVSDTGTGIPPEVIYRIFDPFFTTKKRGEGTGLGLSVVYGIIKGCGGTVTVQSELGAGSVFAVYLPATGHHTGLEEPTQTPVPLGSEKILFVDDENLLATAGRLMLEGLGYQVMATTDSTKALQIFREGPNPFDLVVTDMTMPGLTGADLSREILKIRPDTPIILITGFSDLINEEKARALGIRAFAMKPLRRTNLARLIRKVLDDHESHGD
jgi:PAS domain S-box-containing protein